MQPAQTADHRRHQWALAMLWVIPALWSSNYIIARAAEGVIAPHVLASGRWAFALLLMVPFVWRDRASIASAWRIEWRQCLVLGALGMWICGAFVYIGAQTTTATNIGLIYAVGPVGIALASRWLLNERITSLQVGAMGMALLGVLVVIAKGNLAGLMQAKFVAGDVWLLVACASWIAYSILLQRWSSALGPRQRLACITAGGLLVLLPFTLLEAALQPALPWSWKGGALIVLAGVLPGFLSYQGYALILRELGATRSSLMLYLAPVYGAVNAWWLLGEVPQWFHLLGAALILPSIRLATKGVARSPRAAVQPASTD